MFVLVHIHILTDGNNCTNCEDSWNYFLGIEIEKESQFVFENEYIVMNINSSYKMFSNEVKMVLVLFSYSSTLYIKNTSPITVNKK